MDGGKKICIYGRGEYGLQTYFKLKEYGIKVDCFGDREEKKRGYALDNIYCRSYEEIMKFDRFGTILIIAVKNSGALVEEFKRAGFEYVYSREEIFEQCKKRDKKLWTPLKNIREIEKLKNALEEVFIKNNKKVHMENADMQQVIEDYIKREEPERVGK